MEQEIKKVVRAVTTVYKVSVEQLKSKSRKKNIVEARQTAMFVMLMYNPINNTKLGKYFNRNQATVLHSIRKARIYKQIDPEFKKRFDEVIKVYEGIKDLPEYKLQDTKELLKQVYELFFVEVDSIEPYEIAEIEKRKKTLKEKLRLFLDIK